MRVAAGDQLLEHCNRCIQAKRGGESNAEKITLYKRHNAAQMQK